MHQHSTRLTRDIYIGDLQCRRYIKVTYGPKGLDAIPDGCKVIKSLKASKNQYSNDAKVATVFSLTGKLTLKFIWSKNSSDIKYEVLMQDIFSEYGMGPNVLQYSIFKVRGIQIGTILMEEKQQVLTEFMSIPRSKKTVNIILEKMKKFMEKFCAYGLRHLDAHWNNWIVTQNTLNGGIQVSMIDFSFSTSDNDKQTCKFLPELSQLGRTLQPGFAEYKTMNKRNVSHLFKGIQGIHKNFAKKYKLPKVPDTPEGYNDLFYQIKACRPTIKQKKEFINKNKTRLTILKKSSIFF